MRISGLGYAMPERVVGNDEVLALVEEHSRAHLDGSADRLLARLKALLKISGTRERRWMSDGERAVDFAGLAAGRALSEAGIGPGDIDLLIYVGVGRGWIEPSMAAFFIHELGMVQATGFDILDACLSWLRALDVSNMFLQKGVYRNIMVLNSEFNTGYREWGIRSLDEAAFRFAQMTIGEAATAVVLSAGAEDEPFIIRYKTDASLHDLCKIPLPNIASYNDSEKCPSLDPLVFFAYSAELMSASYEIIPELFFKNPELALGEYDIAFAHSASKTVIDGLDEKLGMSGKTVNLYPEIGNVVSASIPLAMGLSAERGGLERGMRMLLAAGSAGYSAGICRMVY
jgi:acyl-CoA:acyl-CoA alkyltransferase